MLAQVSPLPSSFLILGRIPNLGRLSAIAERTATDKRRWHSSMRKKECVCHTYQKLGDLDMSARISYVVWARRILKNVASSFFFVIYFFARWWQTIFLRVKNGVGGVENLGIFTGQLAGKSISGGARSRQLPIQGLNPFTFFLKKIPGVPLPHIPPGKVPRQHLSNAVLHSSKPLKKGQTAHACIYRTN